MMSKALFILLIVCGAMVAAQATCDPHACHTKLQSLNKTGYCTCMTTEIGKCEDSPSGHKSELVLQLAKDSYCDGCSVMMSLPVVAAAAIISVLLNREYCSSFH